jgi:hypothetical protein
MVLSAINPMKDKLKGIVDKFSNASKDPSVTHSKNDILQKMLSDPGNMAEMMSLLDSSESINGLTTSLKQILEGMMIDGNTEISDPEDVDVVVNTAETDMSPIDAMISPGAFLKDKRKEGPVRKNVIGEIFDNIPKMPPEDYTDFSKEMMSGDDMQEMMAGLTGLLSGNGGNPMELMKTLVGGNLPDMLQGDKNPMELLKNAIQMKGTKS